jgi:DNA-binding NarL/FixJ family response regulator
VRRRWQSDHMVRCLIVDDSPHFLDAAGGLLAREGISVVGVATTGDQAVEQVRRLHPDVLLLDIDLGGESGLVLAVRLHGEAPGVEIILTSTHEEQDFADLIDSSPAVGFLPKTALSGDAIRRLMRRGDGPA